MLLTATDAGNIALDFIMAEWNLNEDKKQWFVVVSSRLVGESWYLVEIGVAGFPDRWFIQVYFNGECETNYTFNSPIRGHQGYADMNHIPHLIAEVLVSERNAR